MSFGSTTTNEVSSTRKSIYPSLLAAIAEARKTGKTLSYTLATDPSATALHEIVERVVRRTTLPASVSRADMLQEGLCGVLSAVGNVDLSRDDYQIVRFLVSHAEHAIQDAQRRIHPLTRSQAQAFRVTSEHILEHAAEKARRHGSGELTVAERYAIATNSLPRSDISTRRVAVFGLHAIQVRRPMSHPPADVEYEEMERKHSIHLAVAIACADHPDCVPCQRAANILATADSRYLDTSLTYHNHLMAAAYQWLPMLSGQ